MTIKQALTRFVRLVALSLSLVMGVSIPFTTEYNAESITAMACCLCAFMLAVRSVK